MISPKKPNILLIMPDQMRGDGLSLAGHPVLETPTLDRIGRHGAYFSRAYTTCASCIPARRSLLTGKYPASTGMVGFKNGYPIADKTLPQALGENGYYTSLVGRYMHQYPYEESYGYQKRTLGSTHVDDDEYANMLMEELEQVNGVRNLFNELGLSYNGWQARSWPYAEELHPTNWVVRKSREQLSSIDDRQPIFLTTSFYAPHPPLFPPEHYFQMFLDRDLPAPALGEWADTLPADCDRIGDKAAARVHLHGETLRRAQAGYFGLIKQIDDQVKPLIEHFKARSEEAGRPWLIVFTSDHGEMLGDHHYFRKCEPYEGSAHIPFLIQGSDELGLKEGVVNHSPVCLEDIMPTILDAAGIEDPGGLDGKSLLPVMRGKMSAVRSVLHSEHAKCYSDDQAYHCLTDGNCKYIWRPLDGEEQLFDLQSDPYELHDLAKDAGWAETLSKWRQELAVWLNGRPEGFSDGEQLFAGRPYGPVLPFLEELSV